MSKMFSNVLVLHKLLQCQYLMHVIVCLVVWTLDIKGMTVVKLIQFEGAKETFEMGTIFIWQRDIDAGGRYRGVYANIA